MSRFEGMTYKLFNYSAPYFRESKIQQPTSREVGGLKYAPAKQRYRAVEAHKSEVAKLKNIRVLEQAESRFCVSSGRIRHILFLARNAFPLDLHN